MTDLSKHGLEPVAWLYECDGDVWSSALEPEPTVEDDWTETPLYRADQVAEVVERLEAALRAIITHYEGRTWGTDAPGHSHRVPGVWDATGKPCEWCAQWNEALEALEGKKP